MKATRFKRVLFAVVTAMGMTAGAVGQLEDGLVRIPAIYQIVVSSTGADYWAGDLPYMFDETVGTCIGDTGGLEYRLDFGTPHAVRQLVVGGRKVNDPVSQSWWQRINNMKVDASVDGVTWTTIYHLKPASGQTIWDIFEHDKLNYYTPTDTTTKFRYLRFYNFDACSGHLSEFGAYTDEVLVRAGAADPFESNAPDSGDHPDGVLLSAALVSGADETYDLVAYAAQTDCGDSLADWKAADGVRSVTLGEKVTKGVSASARLSGLENGRWYWRVFAEDGAGAAMPCDPTHPFALGTTVWHARAYVKNSGAKYVFDGSVSTGGNELNNDAWIVIDLSDLPKGKHLDSLRLWASQTGITSWSMRRMYGASIDFGATDSPLDWGGSVISDQDAVRTVEQVSAIPDGITWTVKAETLVNKAPYGTENPNWLVVRDTVSSRPRYLKIYFDKLQCREIEIRLADDPSGLVAFTNDSEPQRISAPSMPYGAGEISPGVETRISMPSREVYEGTDSAQLCRLQGWTLTVTNAANEEVVIASTDENVDVCAYTPANGDKSAALVWHWKIWSHVPAKVMKVVFDKDGNMTEKNGANWCIEDRNFGSYPGGDYDSTDLLWDLGSQRPVTWFRFSPRNYTITDRYKNFVLYGSNDAKVWTVLYQQGGVAPTINEWHEHWFETPQVYRYFRVGGLLCTEMSEFWLYSDVLMLKATRLVPWASESDFDSMFGDKGVTLNGTLVWSPSGSADVTAYVAESDYGDDLAAWQRHGHAVSVGTVVSGASFTAHVANLPRGIWYGRAFATAGGEPIASNPAVPCQTGTLPFCPQAYVSSGKGIVCDGSTTSGNPDGSGWLVFDISKIPAGHRLAAVRIWPRNNWDGSWNSVVGATIKFGYSDGTETWNVTKVVRDATSAYPTSEASATPAEITWGTMSEVCSTPVVDWMWNKDNVFEMPVTAKTDKLKPRYLYFTCNSMHVREVSLRLVKTPGMAIIVK